VYHSFLGLRVIKKKRRRRDGDEVAGRATSLEGYPRSVLGAVSLFLEISPKVDKIFDFYYY